MLKQHGHYQSAMLHYGGEWYWGVDRLQYLEKRLNVLDLSGSQKILFNQAHNIQQSDKALPVASDEKSPLIIYWSIRSPYSYIGLLRAKRLAAHFQVPLVVKPILPMVMRRMLVPKSKRMYILQDVNREASALNIPFGRVADPLGKGVERCYALFEYAKANQLAVEFLLTYAQAVWSKGICSETDVGLKLIVEQSGLNWFEAKQYLNDNSWKIWAQSHLLDLYQHNKWGVPSFTYEDTTVFGQDRLLQIQHAIESSRQKG
jgi:2-hydroxychromene-2-carboxylate isomerase